MELWDTGVKETEKREKRGKEEKRKINIGGGGGLEIFSSRIAPQSAEPNACIYHTSANVI
jgi:hypothetical protein